MSKTELLKCSQRIEASPSTRDRKSPRRVANEHPLPSLGRKFGMGASTLRRDTRGLSTVEYLIILVLIAVAGLAIWQKIGGHVVKHANEAEGALRDIEPKGG